MIHVRVTDVFCWQRTAADLGHCRWILAHTSVLTHLTSCMISIIWHLPCSFQTISGYPDLVQIHFSIILYGYDGKLCIFSGLSAYGFRHYSLGGHFIGSEADKNKGLTWKEAGCYTTNVSNIGTSVTDGSVGYHRGTERLCISRPSGQHLQGCCFFVAGFQVRRA